MKIIIIFPFDRYGGGGNQFLKALRNHWKGSGIYTVSVSEADIILFNSHHELKTVAGLRRKYPKKIFIHRIDGPVELIRGADRSTDRLIYLFNRIIADGTIFQSKWSKKHNLEKGMIAQPFETVIPNAADQSIFYPNPNQPKNERIRIIVTTNSPNWRKGFKVFQHLDQHLDFRRYQLKLVGRSPVEFKNIQCIKPLPSGELADQLRKSDIYLTASKHDPCSNALIEGLQCGLPAVVLNDGGHPEIMKNAGKLFSGLEDVMLAIDTVAGSLNKYRSNIRLPTMSQVAQAYNDFAQDLAKKSSKDYQPKSLSLPSYGQTMVYYCLWRLGQKYKRLYTILFSGS